MIIFIFFAYLYSCAEGWCQGRMCRAEYDDSFTMNWNRYHIVRWFFETGGIVGMVVFRAQISVVVGILLFISAIPLYEGFFRIARKDTWFYTKTSKWLFGIPHIHWAYEAWIWLFAFSAMILVVLWI